MTQFSVRHGQYEEVNNSLMQATRQMGTILEELNRFLKGMGEATQGKAAPLWGEKQLQWNKAYGEMSQRLSSGATASNGAANAFLDGDNKGAQIMGG